MSRWRKILGLKPRPVSQSVTRAFDPMDQYFSFNNVAYWGVPTNLAPDRAERIDTNFDGMVSGALKGNAVVWACEQRRLSVFTEARFQFRRIVDGRPGELHASPQTRLSRLDKPWTNGTTGDLLARMLLHADFAGNAYVTTSSTGQLRLLRPDWVLIMMGSPYDPEVQPDDIEAEVIGYVYFPGGFMSGRDPVPLMPDEVAHFAPMPDPVAHYRGMSWLTPVVRELEADGAATAHKLQFFRNGATMQTVVSLDKDIGEDAFNRFVAAMTASTRGVDNAYKTVYVGGGADVSVVGADLRQLDFKQTQGAGETRIAAAAGVPPIIVGLSEGLASATYSNYGQAKRAFVDGTMRPLWRNVCGSLATIIQEPVDSVLWYDDRDIAYLREDAKDAAEILTMKAEILSKLINAGWEPDAAIDVVEALDVGALRGRHTGWYSVQMQPPMAVTPPAPAQAASPTMNGNTPTMANAKVPKKVGQ